MERTSRTSGSSPPRIATLMLTPSTQHAKTPAAVSTWFKYNEEVKQTQGLDIGGAVIDIRSDGGYIVAEPTVNIESGKAYE